MKTLAQKQLVLTITIVFVIMLIAGCEEQNKNQPQTNVEVKQARLLVSENVQLQKQLTQCQDELKKRDANIAAQRKLLDECKKQQAVTPAEMEKEQDNIDNSILAGVIDENVSLSQENERIKEQIDKLTKELGEAKK